MAPDPQYCLRWNNFKANITSQFETLRQDEDFVDVTLTCEGKSVRAHKVVLSAISPYFKELFKNNPCKHPIIFLKDVQWCNLCALVEFMYGGVVNVALSDLPSFLQTAESLHILGLADAPRLHKDGKVVKEPTKRASSSVSTPALPASASSSKPDAGDEEDGESQSGSQPNSPPAAKQAKTSEDKNVESSESRNSGEENEQMDESSDAVSSVLLQQSRPGLEITSANDIDQAYNDDLAEMLEPKTELPDYNSDGETRTDANLYMEQSSYGPIPDMMAGPSTQGTSDGTPADNDTAALRKLHSLDPRPCPICQRVYSNLSNLRQHMRLIHIPQSVECPLCSRSFKTKLYLRRHLLSYHEMLSKQPSQNTGSSQQPSQLYIYPVASNMPPPSQPYYSVEEELKRTYLQSPHKSRSHSAMQAHPSQVGDLKHEKDIDGGAISHGPVGATGSVHEQQQQPSQQQHSQQSQLTQSQPQQQQTQQQQQQPTQQSQSTSVSSSFPFPPNFLYAGSMAGGSGGSLPSDYMRSARFNADATHQVHHPGHPHAFAASASNRLGYHNAPYSSNS